MRVLVTGATRPSGLAIISELGRHDVDIVTTEAWSTETLAAQLAEVTHVVHASSLDQPGHTVTEYTADNVHATTELMDACRQRDLQQVLLISTTETYGHAMPPWPVSESWVPRPLGPALQSRVAAERIARTYRRSVPLSILRSAPLVSVGDGVLMQVLRHYVSRPRAGLVGGGESPISVLASADLGRAAWAMLSRPDEAVDQVFHVASAHTTWRELAVEACRLRGVREQFWTVPYAVARGLNALHLSAWALPAPEGIDDYVALTGRPHLIDDSRARVSLGYAPLLGVRAALARALDVYG